MTTESPARPKAFHTILFFLICFVISWAVWVPMALGELGIIPSTIASDSPLNLIAVWGPGLAAILVAVFTAGKAGLRQLFAPLGRWRVGIHWYLFALFYPAALWLLASVVDRLLGYSYETTSVFSPELTMTLPVFILFALPNTLGEELGWRGFALPRLQQCCNALVSSLIVGVMWAIWHIPKWIGDGLAGTELLVAAIGIVVVAILYTWLYNNTQSLLMAWLFHAAATITQYLLPPLPTITDLIIAVLVVVLVVATAGPKRLTYPSKAEAA